MNLECAAIVPLVETSDHFGGAIMRFRILGPLEVHGSTGELIPLHAPKQRALLVVLLLHANQPVSARRVEAALWPGRPPRSADGVIRTYVSGLRRTLHLDVSAAS
jgi:DNA-binding SARP family transcriptional activator